MPGDGSDEEEMKVHGGRKRVDGEGHHNNNGVVRVIDMAAQWWHISQGMYEGLLIHLS